MLLYDGVDVYFLLADFNHLTLDIPLDLLNHFVGHLLDDFLVVGGGLGH